MRALLIGSLAALAVAAPAIAAAQDYRDGNGRAWSGSRNRDGMVLRSRAGTIYLGRECDAYSARYGRGRWEWANGGFAVRFRSTSIRFPRQEIDAGQGLNCRL